MHNRVATWVAPRYGLPPHQGGRTLTNTTPCHPHNPRNQANHAAWQNFCHPHLPPATPGRRRRVARAATVAPVGGVGDPCHPEPPREHHQPGDHVTPETGFDNRSKQIAAHAAGHHVDWSQYPTWTLHCFKCWYYQGPAHNHDKPSALAVTRVKCPKCGTSILRHVQIPNEAR